MRFDVANRKKIQPYQSERKIRAYQTQKNSTIPKRGDDTDAGLMTSATVVKQRQREFFTASKTTFGEKSAPRTSSMQWLTGYL